VKPFNKNVIETEIHRKRKLYRKKSIELYFFVLKTFEIINVNGQQICRAIFVHTKGKKVTDIYTGAPEI